MTDYFMLSISTKNYAGNKHARMTNLSKINQGNRRRNSPLISKPKIHPNMTVTGHMSFTLKLNVNFRELKKEGHFRYKNFLRALK